MASARRHSWNAGPAPLTFARPSTWAIIQQGLHYWRQIALRAGNEDPANVPIWVHAASTGVTRSTNPQSARELVSILLVMAAEAAHFDAKAFAACVNAAKAACEEVGVPTQQTSHSRRFSTYFGKGKTQPMPPPVSPSSAPNCQATIKTLSDESCLISSDVRRLPSCSRNVTPLTGSQTPLCRTHLLARTSVVLTEEAHPPMISKRSPPRPWLGHDRNEFAEGDESAAAGRPTPQLVAPCGRSSSPGPISTDGAPTTTPRKSA
jgi:hypothetical protein